MTKEQIAEFGIIKCPECGKMMAANDLAALNSHMWDNHPDVVRKLALNLIFEGCEQAGLMRRTTRS